MRNDGHGVYTRVRRQRMNRLMTTVLGCSILTLAGVAQAAEVKWQKDFAKAQQLAKKTNRVMVVDFTAPW